MKFGYKQMYIDGQLTDASDGRTYDVICPGDETTIAQIAWASKADTLQALEAAQKGFLYWASLELEERLSWMDLLRSKILEKRDLLRESIMYEMGKIWEGTDEDLTSLTDSLAYYAKEIQKRKIISIEDKEGTHTHQLISQPVGMVVAFLAYNFPLLNLGFKLGPALAAGCSIIIKPSEFSPLSAYLLGEICAEINFPPGVINIICGDVEAVGKPLCESKMPQLITMIGSTETAQKLIIQSSRTSLKRYSMECGGNAPFIVFEDADLNLATAHGAALKIGNSGQICVAPNRFFVHTSVIENFTKAMTKAFIQIRVGFGRENKPDMGPLANRESVNKIDRIVKEAIGHGGVLLCGGKLMDRAGYYFEPTVIRLDDPHAEVLQQEIFGPIAIIVPFNTQEEVIGFANNTDAGLASYVYTKDTERLVYFAEKLAFGEIHLNGFKFDIYLPHGGIKNSGSGVDCSPYALDDYLIGKRVTLAIG